MTDALPYIYVALLIVASAFFSSSETAFASANGLRLKNNAKNGRRLDRMALKVYSGYDNALVAILIGNNLANIASSSVATVIAMQLMGDDGSLVASAVMTVLILILGEIMPKIIAKQTSDTMARYLALPVRFFTIVFTPLIYLVRALIKLCSRLWAKEKNDGPTVTGDDLEKIIDTVEDEGVIDEDRCDLLQSALDFDEVQAYEIITPRVDMLAIDVDDDYDEIVDTILTSPYTRIPVYEDSIDNIIGILHLNRVLKQLVDDEEIFITELLMDVVYVHKTMDISDVLAVMKKKQSHMVIVTDEYGGTMGVLTMEDVLEQLVGDIWDESDQIVDEFKKVGKDLYEADGDMRIEDFFEELELEDEEPDDDNATVGGWVIEMLGGYPKQGDSFDYKNITVTVKKRRNLRVMRVTVQVRPPEPDGDDD